MRVAATTGPRPNSSVSEVPDAAMASAMRLGGSHLGVEAAQVVEVLEGERVACHCDGALRLPLGEHALGAGGVDLVGDPAGHELSQQRMQPAADRCAVAPLSTHTSARSQRASNSLESQTAADVRHIESQPARTQTLRITRGVALATQSGTYALGPFESTGRRFGGPGHDFRGTVRSRLFD
jgi:hypothetical protein